MMTGRIHSIQTLGTVDGPGVRFVVFMQGCNLRCGCCHNPDTWAGGSGKDMTVEQLMARVVRYREYFGEDGGITVSGGEPLLQAEFVAALFEACHRVGINTCLDTSGDVWNEAVQVLLSHTDRVLLDIKYTTEAQYRAYVGCGMDAPLGFLDGLQALKIPTTLRQVIIPTLNDDLENLVRLAELAKKHPCVDQIELLPFKKICKVKYDSLGIPFPFESMEAPSAAYVSDLRARLNDFL